FGAVGRVVIFAAEPVVVDTGNIGRACVEQRWLYRLAFGRGCARCVHFVTRAEVTARSGHRGAISSSRHSSPGSSVMMAYRPLRVVSRHASKLGPRRPLQIAKENAGNADSSRARSIRIHAGVASFGCSEGHCFRIGSVPKARPGSALPWLGRSCLHLWTP